MWLLLFSIQWGMVKQFEFSLHFYELFIVLFWSQNTSVSIHFVTSISCKGKNVAFQAVGKLYIGSYICFQTLNTIDLSCYCYHGQVYSDDHEAKTTQQEPSRSK